MVSSRNSANSSFGQVVVAADVAPGALDGLHVVRRLAAHGQRAQPLQPGRHEVVDMSGEDGEQPGQVGAVPVAGHVGLAEPDQAAGTEAAEELPRPVQDHDRGGRILRAEQPAVRQPDPQRQLGYRGSEQGARHGRAHGRARRHGDIGPPVCVEGHGGLRAGAGHLTPSWGR